MMLIFAFRTKGVFVRGIGYKDGYRDDIGILLFSENVISLLLLWKFNQILLLLVK